jgi:hypothetical protein
VKLTKLIGNGTDGGEIGTDAKGVKARHPVAFR